jgi:hypothetical protein
MSLYKRNIFTLCKAKLESYILTKKIIKGEIKATHCVRAIILGLN